MPFRSIPAGYGRVRRAVRTTLALFVLCGAGIACRPLLAHAALRIADDSPHAALWRRIYEQLPPSWKTERPVVVEEVSDEEMDRLVERTGGNDNSAANGTVVDGCYQGGDGNDAPAIITLRETLRSEESEMVFAHEYGHFLWDERLTEAQQARYKRLWRAQKRARHLVTTYASESPEEGFAEACSYFLRKPSALRRRDPLSWQFLTYLAAAPPPDTAKESRDNE